MIKTICLSEVTGLPVPGKNRLLTFYIYNGIIKRKGGDEMKPNLDLRLYAKGHGVPLWRIAQEFGFSEQTMIMRLRKQYSKEDAEEFMRIVDKISREE
jgi:hypothetical protein